MLVTRSYSLAFAPVKSTRRHSEDAPNSDEVGLSYDHRQYPEVQVDAPYSLCIEEDIEVSDHLYGQATIRRGRIHRAVDRVIEASAD